MLHEKLRIWNEPGALRSIFCCCGSQQEQVLVLYCWYSSGGLTAVIKPGQLFYRISVLAVLGPMVPDGESTRAKFLYFCVAVLLRVWYGLAVFHSSGAPCPTEQTAAKLAVLI